jgi:hypothetical protein
MKYRKKPIVIEAFQYDGDLIDSKGEYYVPDWVEKAFEDGILFYDSINKYNPPYELFIKDIEGNILVSVGDYIIQDIHGKLYPCKPYIFEKTYEKVEA